MTDAAPKTRWHRFEILIIAGGCMWFVGILPFVSNTSFDFCASAPLLLFGIGIGVCWLARTAANLALRRLPKALAWFSVPAAPILAALLAMTIWPLELRLRACEQEMQNYVDGLVKSGATSDRPGRVGSFAVNRVEVWDGAVYLHTSDLYLDSTGLAHIPPGTPPNPSYRDLRHLCGNWYTFYWRF